MPGVKTGDIGPKMGYNSKNNGWCTFDHVRIPRTNMLMKFASVDKEGCFAIEGDVRALYSTMVGIRIWLLWLSAFYLLRGTTVAIRYSAVRRQFKNTAENKKEETQILNYQS